GPAANGGLPGNNPLISNSIMSNWPVSPMPLCGQFLREFRSFAGVRRAGSKRAKDMARISKFLLGGAALLLAALAGLLLAPIPALPRFSLGALLLLAGSLLIAYLKATQARAKLAAQVKDLRDTAARLEI